MQHILADIGNLFESDLIVGFVESLYFKGEMNVVVTSYVLCHGKYSGFFKFLRWYKNLLISLKISFQDATFEPINGALRPMVIDPCHPQYDAFVWL